MAELPTNDPRQYFAAEPESGRCAANVIEKIRRYRQWLKQSGRSSRMVRSWRTYHGQSPDGNGDTNRTGASGEQGEWVDVTGNDYATLVTQTVVLTTQDKPAFKAIATNTDSTSLEQTSFAQGLLDYYDKRHSLQDRDRDAVRFGTVLGEGWEVQSWDATAGKSLTDFVEGPPLHEGDIRVHAAEPFRIAYDPDTEDVDSLEWFAFKRRYNRHGLANTIQNKNPEAAEKLREISSGAVNFPWEDAELDFEMVPDDGRSRTATADLVWVWEFRHKATPALPKGRLLLFVSDECVVYDSAASVQVDSTTGQPVMDVATGRPAVEDLGYPYDELHAYRFSPDVVIGSIAGHTAAFDLIGLQELKDTVLTMAASAANAGGVLNLWTPGKNKPRVSQVIGALNFIESEMEPKPIKGVELSAQVPAFESLVDKQMMRRLGQSDVSMGEVPKGMPGNLAALLDAKTVQYHSQGQACYRLMLERSRTGLLKMLKRFAKTKRVAVIGGKSNDYKLKSWSAEDLAGVDRFSVEAVNPLTQTYSGKQDAAKDLLSSGLIKDAQQFLTLRETGKFEVVLESETSSLDRIKREKEMLRDGVGLPPLDAAKSLMKGQPVFVDDGKPHIIPLAYDRHWLDIVEDLAVLDPPEARRNVARVAAVTGVVEERKRLLKQMDPVMLTLLKAPPELIQAIMAERTMMAPPMPGETSGTKPPAPGEESSSKLPETPGLPDGAPRIAAARPPKNPLTGEQKPSPIATTQA